MFIQDYTKIKSGGQYRLCEVTETYLAGLLKDLAKWRVPFEVLDVCQLVKGYLDRKNLQVTQASYFTTSWQTEANESGCGWRNYIRVFVNLEKEITSKIFVTISQEIIWKINLDDPSK